MALRVVRFGLGGLAWLAPRTAARLMLIDSATRPLDGYLMRLFGVRDALMGVDLTLARDEPELRRHLHVGIAVDLLDVAAAVAALNTRARPAGVAYRCGAGLIGAWLGAAALRQPTSAPCFRRTALPAPDNQPWRRAQGA